MSQRVFITGVATGMGLELARRFVADGAVVGGCGIEDPAAAAAALPPGCFYRQADVTDAARMRDVIGEFIDEDHRLDVLVANAGISMPKAAFPDFERGRQVIEINVLGVINSFAPAMEQMRRQRAGQLVAMGSFAGLAGLPGMACYSASKAAVLSLCESLAIDLKSHGIAVTAIAPGFIATALTRDNPHAMPFLMQPGEAADKIYRAIRRRRERVIIPWPMALLGAVLRGMPRGLYRMLMRADPAGLRKQEASRH